MHTSGISTEFPVANRISDINVISSAPQILYLNMISSVSMDHKIWNYLKQQQRSSLWSWSPSPSVIETMESIMIAGQTIHYPNQHSFRFQVPSQVSKVSPVAAHSTYIIMTLGTSTDNELHNTLFLLIYHRHHDIFKDTDWGSQHGYQWQHGWVTSISQFPWPVSLAFGTLIPICSKVLLVITHCLVACVSRNLKYTIVSVSRDIKRVSNVDMNM